MCYFINITITTLLRTLAVTLALYWIYIRSVLNNGPGYEGDWSSFYETSCGKHFANEVELENDYMGKIQSTFNMKPDGFWDDWRGATNLRMYCMNGAIIEGKRQKFNRSNSLNLLFQVVFYYNNIHYL